MTNTPIDIKTIIERLEALKIGDKSPYGTLPEYNIAIDDTIDAICHYQSELMAETIQAEDDNFTSGNTSPASLLPCPKEHDLKIWSRHFNDVISGKKKAEHRVNDRDFQVGDTLLLREVTEPECQYTGRKITVTVTHIIRGGEMDILSIELPKPAESLLSCREACDAFIKNIETNHHDLDYEEIQVIKKAWQAAWQYRKPEWQPIETAPKDGTRVLLYVEQKYSGKNFNISYFITDAYCDEDEDWMTGWGHDTVESISYNVDDFAVNPTHWMSLPKPTKPNAS